MQFTACWIKIKQKYKNIFFKSKTDALSRWKKVYKKLLYQLPLTGWWKNKDKLRFLILIIVYSFLFFLYFLLLLFVQKCSVYVATGYDTVMLRLRKTKKERNWDWMPLMLCLCNSFDGLSSAHINKWTSWNLCALEVQLSQQRSEIEAID